MAECNKTRRRKRTGSGMTPTWRANQHKGRLLRKARQRGGKFIHPGDDLTIPELEKFVRSLDRGPAVKHF